MSVKLALEEMQPMLALNAEMHMLCKSILRAPCSAMVPFTSNFQPLITLQWCLSHISISPSLLISSLQIHGLKPTQTAPDWFTLSITSDSFSSDTLLHAVFLLNPT